MTARRKVREVRHVTFTAAADVTAGMVARESGPQTPRACVTITDADVTWLVSFPDRDTAVLLLAKAAKALDDLHADLARRPDIVDLDRIRQIRDREQQR